MTYSQAFSLVLVEGASEAGMVVETRAGIDPGEKRVNRLREALAIVANDLKGKTVINRDLANALYGISFHMSETLRQWENCKWLDLYFELIEIIDSIFDEAYPPISS